MKGGGKKQCGKNKEGSKGKETNMKVTKV